MARLAGHTAQYEVARDPDEGNSWTVTCSCGDFQESASSRSEARHEHAGHKKGVHAQEVNALVGYEARLHKMLFMELVLEARRVNADIFTGITRPILISRILEAQDINDRTLTGESPSHD